jgi:four helix bundle protein
MANTKFDLEDRLSNYGEKVIELCSIAYKNDFVKPISTQLLRSGTSIGANYCEANGASSKSDFKNKIHICKKEAIETKYWLRMLSKAYPDLSEKCRDLWKDTQEYTLIFSKIIGTLQENRNLRNKN